VKSISGKQLAKLLEKYGWTLARINGSHHIYIKSERKERISVPIHGNKDIKFGLLSHILKIAGISQNEIK
jgi:predicted RNA binding protein YcfA (HicA-like mRNA interferase family)